MMQLTVSLKMLLQIILILSICVLKALALDYVYESEACSDCSALEECIFDKCINSATKVGWLIVGVIFLVIVSCCACAWIFICLSRRRRHQSRNFQNVQYSPSSSMPPPYTQQQMGNYPHQSYPN